MSDLVGTTLGAYHIEAEIGRGGMAVVYKAYQPALERYVAVKVLPQELAFDQEFVQRFLREARSAARLNHPGIVTVHDVGQADGTYFIVMEYVAGQSLTDLLRRQKALPRERVGEIVSQVASALDYAHRHGFVHRDVKPSNILLDSEGRAKLTDFGIVQAVEGTRLTRTGTLLGTPEYMSPEQAKGERIGPATDTYSLAVVAYEMLSGRAPFKGETMAVLHAHAYEAPDLSVLPRGFQSVVGRALAKAPDQRYRSPLAFAEALRRAVSGATPSAEPRTGSAPRALRVPVWLWGVGAAVLLLGVLVATIGGPIGAPEAEPTRLFLSRTATPAAAASATVASNTPTSAPTSGPTPTGPLAVVAEPTATIAPSAKPGAKLAFDSHRNGHWDVYTMNDDGSDLVNLTNHPAEDGDPSWSPDGERIAFDTDRDGNWEIYTMAADGSDPVRLTDHPADDDHPAWSPDGGRIAFRTNRDGNWELYAISLADRTVVNLSHHPADDQMPAWSPDGQHLAFASNREGNWDLYVAEADGSTPVRVTHHPADDVFPTWSPDGRRIAFHSYRDGNAEVYTVNRNGTGLVRLTHDPADDWAPDWSSDGDHIAFVSDRDGNNEIYVVDVGGTNLHRLTFSDASDTWPVWKPPSAGGKPTAEISTPTSCPAVSGPFADSWSAVRDGIGCPAGGPVQGQIVEENFDGGKMFWREPVDTAQALVLFGDGTWRIFKHAPYQESMPEFPCADATTPARCPPTPKRGFGMRWCDIPEIRRRLGNAIDCERSYTGWMQTFEQGFMLRTDRGTTYVCLDDGRWERK